MNSTKTRKATKKTYKVKKDTLEQIAEKRFNSFLEERLHGNLFDLYFTKQKGNI